MTTSVNLSPSKKKAVLWLAMFIMPIAGSGIYLYVPSLPAIAKELQAQPGMVQLTVALYALGLGVPQIFFGIWSDIIGRRKLLIPALAAFAVVTIIIPFSPNIYVLLLLRLLQGILVAVPEVLIKALMSDTFAGDELDRNANYLVMAWSIGPILMPVIGTYLKQDVGGSYPFYVLALYGLISSVLCLFFLPETNPHPKKFNFKEQLHSYKTILFNQAFISAIVCMVSVYSIVAIFNAQGPFLVQNYLKASPATYGRLAFIVGIAWLIGNLANRFHARRNDLDKVVTYRMFFLIIVSSIMALLGILGINNFWAFAVPLFLLFYASGLIFPRLFAKALGMFPEYAGAAAAILGTLIMVGGSITTGLGGLLNTNSQVPLATAYLILSLTFAVVYWFGMHRYVKK